MIKNFFKTVYSIFKRDRCIVMLDFKTMEYMSVIAGQVPFGNEKRRNVAVADLAKAIGKRSMITSTECFENAQWTVIVQKK